MAAEDDPEEEIGEAVVRRNPRKEHEPMNAWKRRLSSILSRAVKRYWNDLYAIQTESGVDTDAARKLYREALKQLGIDRREAARKDIIEIVAASVEEKAPTTPKVSETVILSGREYVWELENTMGATINSKLVPGYHDYEMVLWIYKGARLMGNDTVVFGASPSEFFYSYHEAARDFLRDVLGSDSPKGITFIITELRIVA